MKIRILQVGKTKEDYLSEGIEEYVKRLSKSVSVKFVTVKDDERLLKALDGDEYLIVLDEKGKEFSSVGFAKVFSNLKDEGRKVCFVIGGAYGLPEEVKERADLLMALSQMTFTHQMVRLILMEQIYRSWCIMSGRNYHHE